MIDIKKLLKGDRRALAKAITTIESSLETDRVESQKILESILPHTGKSIRIGVTGIPGVGKSTFIETFGLLLTSMGNRVAVLAVDPSSPIHGGSILGDKTRMVELATSDNAFIRPSPTSGSLGGVARKTRETILLCEAARYDIILIETVGVGQSEVEVASMVDFFMVLMLPNAGDELQGIKKGILELADAIVINKADGESVNMARLTKQHYQSALHLLCHCSYWTPEVLTCSATENDNIDIIWEMIKRFKNTALKYNLFNQKRNDQNLEWMKKIVHEMLDLRLKQNIEVQKKWYEMETQIHEGKTTAFFAAQQILKLLP